MRLNVLNKALHKLDYDELVEHLMEYAKKDKLFAESFYQQIEDKVKNAHEAEARNEVDASFARNIPKGGPNNPYYETDWYSIMVDNIKLFKKANQSLKVGNLRHAVAYPLQWLRKFNEEFTEEAFSFDDDGFEFVLACEEALAIIEKVILHPQADASLKRGVCDELSKLAEAKNVFEDYSFADIKDFANRMTAFTESPKEAQKYPVKDGGVRKLYF